MTTTGLVFDIQRCSLHDGPGIRTTIFLKGCPLKCIWCHNPEAITFQPQISWQSEQCIDCMSCVEVCSNGAQINDDGTHRLDFKQCRACGTCNSVCPMEALTIIGQPMTPEAVFAEVMQDSAFYAKSGGGLTISGGEPTAQQPFTLALLKLAKDAGIHTCVETCGFAPTHRYDEVMPLTDLFLFDFKATDSATHTQLTGVPNEKILANLDHLYTNGAKIVLRCPLIPGINDDAGHLAGIAALAARYPNLLGVEIMAYHDMGESKAEHIGVGTRLPDVKTADPATQAAWIDTLHDLGCTVARISE